MKSAPPLRARYGQDRQPAWSRASGKLGPRARITIVVALVLAAVIAAVIAARESDSPVGAQTVHYDVVDSTLTRTTVSVVPDQARDIVCGVQATSDFQAVVGYREIVFPANPNASTSSPQQVDVEIRTTQEGASGHYNECWFKE